MRNNLSCYFASQIVAQVWKWPYSTMTSYMSKVKAISEQNVQEIQVECLWRYFKNLNLCVWGLGMFILLVFLRKITWSVNTHLNKYTVVLIRFYLSYGLFLCSVWCNNAQKVQTLNFQLWKAFRVTAWLWCWQVQVPAFTCVLHFWGRETTETKGFVMQIFASLTSWGLISPPELPVWTLTLRITLDMR